MEKLVERFLKYISFETTSDESSDTFKEPSRESLLGLDKLALIRQKEKLQSCNVKKFKDSEDCNKNKNKNYRKSIVETPTHTGGVSYEARKRAEERSEKYKERRLHASTKDRNNYRHESKYRYQDRKFRDYRDKDRSARRLHDRSSRSSRLSSESPRFKDEPQTPNYKLKNPISKTSWDEDDAETVKKSSWDYPTPLNDKNQTEWSERRLYKSERRTKSRRLDDSTRPTPAFRYNNWAKDRKKTGATPSCENCEYAC